MDSGIQSQGGAQDDGAVRSMKCSATVTAKDGLLWRNGGIIPLPEADRVANEHGFQYAEQMVRALQAKSPNAALGKEIARRKKWQPNQC